MSDLRRTPQTIVEVTAILKRGVLPPPLLKEQRPSADQVAYWQALQCKALEAADGGPPLSAEETAEVQSLSRHWAEAARGKPDDLGCRYPKIAACLLVGTRPAPRDVWGPLGPVLGEGV